MGYRSEVAFGIGFRTRDKLLSFITSVKLGDITDKDYMDDLCVIDFGDVWLIHGEYEDIKWYDGFSEVDNTEKLLAHAGVMGLPTAFIRIGEDTSDIVEDYGHADNEEKDIHMWHFYCVDRSIDKPRYDSRSTITEMFSEASNLRA